MTTCNLTQLLGLRRDRYAKRQGDFILGNDIGLLGNGPAVWRWFRNLGGLQIRIAYLCENGVRRDIIGRQGVHESTQDGPLTGGGRPMANEAGLTLSFWTCVFDDPDKPTSGVNTGAGKGYRTLRADRILAVSIQRDGANVGQCITDTGLALIELANQL